MGALAIGRGAGMDDDRLAGGEHAMQVRHRRIEGKEAVELERWRLAVKGERVVAAQRGPVRIADRCDSGEPVEGASQHDGEKARIAAFGDGKFRHIGPGEQRARGQQQFAARGGMEVPHDQLSKNSGAMTRSVMAWARLSARAMVLRVSTEARGPRPASSSASGSAMAPTWVPKSLAMSSRCATPSIHAAAVSGQPFGAGGRHRDSPSWV